MIDIYYCNHKRCRGVPVPSDRREPSEQHSAAERTVTREKVAWYLVEGQSSPYFCGHPVCLGHTYDNERCPPY